MTDTDKLVTIEVDGRELQVAAGSMLIEATDEAGITVPRFCYHNKLSVAANCRMCLVEVERSGKPLPACATPVADGMKVWTASEKAKAAQQDVMEFLLINHPLDCPICDQGGECELQDVSVGYGNGSSQYVEMKRVVRDKDIGPLIETEMTRCIHCTRCVRFGEEVAGLREMGATGRSEHVEIGTYVSKAVTSELSGNVIDLCPVGALTAKPSRYKARAWEMRAADSIAPHDSVGSNISVHTFDGQAVRVVPRDNESINECWISDRDRFSYQGITSPNRLLKPQIKRDGQWQVVSWQEALESVAAILSEASPATLGALASPTSTLEELYLFQKLMRGAGFNHIDHRLRQVDFSDQDRVSAAPILGVSILELEQQQAVLLIGSNVRHDQPMLNHRLRKAAEAGGRIMALNPRQVDFNYDVVQQVVKPMDMVAGMARIAKALSEVSGKVLPTNVVDLCQSVDIDDTDREMAAYLVEAEKPLVLLGNMGGQHPHSSTLRALSSVVAALSDGTCGCLQEAANSVGAALAGVLPHRQQGGEPTDNAGMNVREMLSTPLRHWILLNTDIHDFSNSAQAKAAFSTADEVIVMSPFADEQVREYATVLLPLGCFAETSGTFVNIEGRWQGFAGVSKAPGEARPGWKVLRVLGNQLNVPEFDYVSSQEVVSEIKLELQLVKPGNQYSFSNVLEWPGVEGGLQRIGDVPIYRSDALVREASALQAMLPEASVRMNPADLAALSIDSGDQVTAEQEGGNVQLPVEADEAVPAGAVWFPAATDEGKALGDAFGYINVSKV